MKKSLVLLLISLVALFSFGCKGPQRLIDPTLIQELRGYIRPEQKEYKVNQPIKVNYWLANVTDNPIREQIADGSNDPKLAFQGYSFNAMAEDNSRNHLELKDAGKVFHGILELEAGKERIFFTNVFKAAKPGAYILTLELRWRDGKKIAFKPVTIRVRSEQVAKKSTTDPEIEKALLGLASKDYKVRVKAKEKIKTMGKVVAPYLVKLLNNSDIRLRSEAMFSLIALKKEAVPTLLGAARHKDREIRMRVIYALGQIGDNRAISILGKALLRDPDKEIRATVLRVVTENFIDQIAVPLMIRALSDSDPKMRKDVVEALRKRTSISFDFFPLGKQKEREKAIERWKQWWQKAHPDAFK